MTDVLTLDLSAQADGDLLVPFSRPSAAPQNSRAKETEALFQNKRQGSSRGLGRFFRRQEEEKEPEPEKNLPRTATTFAFPKARVEQAEIEPEPFKDSKPEQKPDSESDSDEESGSEDDDDDDDDEEEERPQPRRKTSKKSDSDSQRQLKRLDDWDPTENPYFEEKTESRAWKMEGFGSTPMPSREDESKNGFGRFFRRLGGRRSSSDRDDELQSMRVATEDTKDKKTLTEQITKAALVVMVPELYADEEDGDGNLGMYRSIRMTADEELNQPNVCPTVTLKTQVKQLQNKVKKLERALKSAELETNSWKLRAKELEAELRRYKGQDEDDSSVEPVDDDEDSEDDGIEEEWTGFDGVKEGKLLDISEEKEKVVFDPLAEDSKVEKPTEGKEDNAILDLTAGVASTSDIPSTEKEKNAPFDPMAVDSSSNAPNGNDADLLDQMTTTKEVVFDPLAANASSAVPEKEPSVEAEESADDTSKEKLVFDPLAVKTEEKQ